MTPGGCIAASVLLVRGDVGDPGPRHPGGADRPRGRQARARERQAPRNEGYVAEVLTERARDARRAAVIPSTTSRSPQRAQSPRSRCASSTARSRPIDAAFAEGVTGAPCDPARGRAAGRAPERGDRTRSRRSMPSAGRPFARRPRGCSTRSNVRSSGTRRCPRSRDGIREPVRGRPHRARDGARCRADPPARRRRTPRSPSW